MPNKMKSKQTCFISEICLMLLVSQCLTAMASKCPKRLEGECQCNEFVEESSVGLRVECAQTTTKMLLNDIYALKKSGKSILSLQVRNSDLRDLYNLPSGLYDVHELILDNTGIDFQTIRESHELLTVLKVLRVYHENFTEVSHSFAQQLSMSTLIIRYLKTSSMVWMNCGISLSMT